MEHDELEKSTVYKDSELFRIKHLRQQKNKPFVVIFTDIDDTFFRKDRIESTKALSQEIESEGYALIAVTGSSPSRIIELSQKGVLPYFSAVMGAVGTKIAVRTEGSGEKVYHEDVLFRKRLESSTFDRQQVIDRTTQIIQELSHERDHLGIVFQTIPPEPYKVSLNFYPQSIEDVDRVRQLFQQTFPSAKIIICAGNTTDREAEQYCLDIVPVGKSDAVQYLTQIINPDVTIVAGDSGNDSRMLVENGNIAIAVGDAKPMLVETLNRVVYETQPEDGNPFIRVKQADGSVKLYYHELSKRVGPESMLYALQLLQSQELAVLQ